MADSVGRIYVDVIADTSRMKDQIKKAGVRAGRDGAQAFTKAFQKEVDKSNKKIQFDRLAKKFTEDMTRDIAAQIKANAERGIHSVDMTPFSEKWAAEMARIAKLTGMTQVDMAKAWKKYYEPAMHAAYDALEKEEKAHKAMREKHALEILDEEKKAAKKLADYDKSLRDKRTREVLASLDRTIRQVERDIKKEHDLRVKMNKDVDRDTSGTLAKWFSGFERGLGRASNSLRRMGTGGFFDSLTNMAGALVGFLGNMPKLAKLALKPIELLGKGILGIGTALMKAGGWLGKFGGMIAKFGGSIMKFAKHPLVLAGAAIAMLSTGLAIVGKLLSFVLIILKTAGTMLLQFASWAGMAAASAAVLAPMLIAIGIGAGVAFLGMKDAAGAAKTYFSILNEDDPEKRAEMMKEYNEQLKKLGPNTRAAVKALEPLMNTFKGIKTELSERIFKDVADDLAGLAPLMTIIKDGMGGVADSVGIVVGKFIELFQSAQFLKDVTDLFSAARNIVRDLGTAAADVFGGLTTVFAIIAPLAERLAEGLMFAAQNFKAFTESEEGQKKITDFFTKAYEQAGKLWGVIKDVAAGIGALLFAVSEDTGQASFIDRIAEAAEKFRAWASDPKTKEDVSRWITEAKDAFDTLKEVVGTLITEWNKLDTPENRKTFTTVVTTIGNLIGLIFDLIGVASFIYGALYAPFKPIVEIVGRLIGLIKDLIAWIGRIKMPEIKLPDWLPGDQGGSGKSGRSGGKGKAAGGFVYAPTRVLVGEAGAEAIIPLARPLSQIDPSVRAMAALLRGQQKTKASVASTATIGTTMSNTFNITSQAEDPRTVATQVVNRLAASTR